MARPAIRVPAIVLHGECDGVDPPANSEAHARHFVGPYEREVVARAGHFLPRESPGRVVAALETLRRAVPR